jgi:hypothetical protein
VNRQQRTDTRRRKNRPITQYQIGRAAARYAQGACGLTGRARELVHGYPPAKRTAAVQAWRDRRVNR